MKKLGLLVLWLLCGILLPLAADAKIEDGVYTVEGGNKTVIGYDMDYFGGIVTVASGDLDGYYFWGRNESSYDNSGNLIPGKEWETHPTNGVEHDDDWGGGNDDDSNGYNSGINPKRQGPCPEGYHVPSRGEFNTLEFFWDNKNGGNTWGNTQVRNSFLEAFNLGVDYYAISSNVLDTYCLNLLSNPTWYFKYPMGTDCVAVNRGKSEYDDIYDRYKVRCFKDVPIAPQTYVVSFFSGTQLVASGEIVDGGLRNEDIPSVTKEGYKLDYRHLTGVNEAFDFTSPITGDITLYAKWSINKDIVIQATATESGQTLKINKYFKNAYTVDRGDDTSVLLLDSDNTYAEHTFSTEGVHTITLSLTGGAERWTFTGAIWSLVPIDGTTMTGIKIISMPSLADGFGISPTDPGNNFFRSFNYKGALMSLPGGSFDTSYMETVGNNFFQGFNYEGKLKTLPDDSFDISNIKIVGGYFFQSFNVSGALISLPNNSFDTSNIKIVGDGFFNVFNRNGALTVLPNGSFNISNITGEVGDYFFGAFNRGGALTSLPNNSFDISNITKVGDNFFNAFNYEGKLTSLPDVSFDTSNITKVGNSFFNAFNYGGKLTGLPNGSFNISNITGVVGDFYFYHFNQGGSLRSLPNDSFDISNITNVGTGFFQGFNCEGALTSLPDDSFNTSNIKTVGESFFRSFNDYGALTSLPGGSFNLSGITSAGANFFRFFNGDGKLTILPDSFTMSSVGASASYGYRNAFNSAYTLNKDVSDLVNGKTVPSSDRNVFSDNQPGRCGVHTNWLVNPTNACNVKYDANGGIGTITGGYNSNITGIVPGLNITLPTREWYTLSGWLDASGNIVDEVVFPDMDGQTLYANWIPIAYKINYELNDGVLSGNNATGYTIESETITLINPTKTGYTFTGRSGTELNSLTTSVTIPTGSTGDREYEANWEINQYTITFKDGDNEITSITADYGTGITPPSNPTKNGYRFVGWEPEVPATMPAENITINAKWDKTGGGSSGGGGGGGGGGSSSKTDTGSTSSGTGNQINSNTGDIASTGTNIKEPGTNTGSSIQTGSQVDSNTGSIVSSGTNVNNPSTDTPGDSIAPSQNDKTYSTEFQEAYEFAKGNGITTMPTIQKANMEGKLTRIAMAKMLSQYAINVLGKTPDTSQSNKFNDVTDKLDSDYDDGVTLAYQLGIMGQNMPGNNFRPDDDVTRAEFATALSRMLYNTSDGQYKSTDKYYTNHMSKLVKEGIITKDDPKMKELRGYVMIMLMRSAK